MCLVGTSEVIADDEDPLDLLIKILVSIARKLVSKSSEY